MCANISRSRGFRVRKVCDDVERFSWISVLAAGGLLVAACGSSDSMTGSATVGTSASASSSSSSSSSSKSTAPTSSEDSTTEESGTSADSSTQAPAAELDAATTTWFTTFCTSLGEIGQYVSPDTAGQSLNQEQATVATAYTGISTSATKAAGALQATPPPTITSGSEIASATTVGFQDLADVYGRGAQTIAALTPSTEADLKAAVDAVESEAKAAAPKSLADLDPGVETAVKQLPECAGIVG